MPEFNHVGHLPGSFCSTPVFGCSDCGALLLEAAKEKHDKWHKNQAKAVAAALRTEAMMRPLGG